MHLVSLQLEMLSSFLEVNIHEIPSYTSNTFLYMTVDHEQIQTLFHPGFANLS